MEYEISERANFYGYEILQIRRSLDSAAAEQYKKYGDTSNGVIIIQVKDLKKYKKEK